ncbi:transglutaminase family protein [Kineococcus glutinatus]|uniref:Transglutaminase family protein n=1 Tax=Kineococcus glutinatus TaxID=1070872 RepID=A0ABP9IAU1_9ACTN
MRLRVEHVTTLRYEGSATASYNEARMTPLTTPDQTALDARFAVSPHAAVLRYWDYWGSHVTAFDVHTPHTELVTTASAIVETDRPAGTPADAGAGWADLAAPAVADRFVEQVRPTSRTRAPAEVAERARELAAAHGPHETALRLCGWLREEVAYVPGATGVHDTAAESWQQRRGVCQDIAHLACAALREVGVPARYVSGYLHPTREPEVGREVVGESHAWVEFWTGAWCGWDPTNDVPVGERHVVVARARDFSDVSPLHGVYSGPASSVEASVRVTRLA